jgi:hypothetical protein
MMELSLAEEVTRYDTAGLDLGSMLEMEMGGAMRHAAREWARRQGLTCQGLRSNGKPCFSQPISGLVFCRHHVDQGAAL